MSTMREQIAEAIVTALNTSPPTGVPTTVRSPFAQTELTADEPLKSELIWLEDVERPEGDDDGPLQEHELTVVIGARAIGSDGDIPETVLDPFAAWVVKALHGNRLNGLVNNMRVTRTAKTLSREQVMDSTAVLFIFVRVLYTSDAFDFESDATP